MAFIFIDESGQFTKHKSEEYFVIASFTVGDPRRTEKAFRSWCRTRFPKKMRGQNEIKWSASGIDDKLRIKTLKYIMKLDVRIRFGFLLRKNIPSKFRNKENKIESGLLYTNIIGQILETYLPIHDSEVYVFCDARSLKGVTKKEFEKTLINQLTPLCLPKTKIGVEMIDSTSSGNIQIADWISGAIAKYLEEHPLGKEYFNILKNNLLGEGKELFAL